MNEDNEEKARDNKGADEAVLTDEQLQDILREWRNKVRPKKPGVELSYDERFRVIAWAKKVLSIADCSLPELGKRYVLNIPHLTFDLYLNGVRSPIAKTLTAIEEGHTVRDLHGTPFKGTRQWFEVGPDGQPLWKILEGDLDACSTHLHSYLDNKYTPSERLKASFPKKAAMLFELVFHPEQIEELENLFDNSVDIDDFAYPLLVRALSYNSNFSHKMTENTKAGEKYDWETLVACLAFREIAYERQECLIHADYLFAGVCREIVARMPELEREIQDLFVEDIKEKNQRLYDEVWSRLSASTPHKKNED